jgi:hypothetical protein
MEFLSNLSKLIHNSPENTQTLIEKFNIKGGVPAFITPYFEKIPLVKVKVNGFLVAGNNSTPDSLDLIEPHGRGTFSNVYHDSKEPFVYKIVHDYAYAYKGRAFLRHVFKEMIVQTLLQNDPKYGSSICKLEAVYRTENDVIFKIEKLNKPFTALLLDLNKKLVHPPDYSVAVRDLMVNVLEIVDYFHKTYSFHHYDLHADNIMVDSENKLKLIDFGWDSYVKIGTHEIGFLDQSADDSWRLIWSIKKTILREKLSRPFNVILDSLEAVGHRLMLTDTLNELRKLKSIGGRRQSKTKKRRSRKNRNVI